MQYLISEKCLEILVTKLIYNHSILFKCFYWYGGDYTVAIDELEESYKVTITLRSDATIEFEGCALYERVLRDLNDFKLRDIVTKETKDIRDLLVAKAFSYEEEEEDPNTIITDPVGFKIPTD